MVLETMRTAAIRDDVEIAESIIESGTDPNEPWREGSYLPLQLAAREGACNVAKYLVDIGADVDGVPEPGKPTPLMLAASNSHLDVVRLLIDAGADVNATRPGGTSVICSASKAEGASGGDIIRTLIAAGVDISKYPDDQTPLLLVAVVRGSEALAALLDAGCDPNGYTMKYVTPLHAAVITAKNDWNPRNVDPKNRVDEAINLIIENARYAKLLEETDDGKFRLQSSNEAVGVGTVDERPIEAGVASSQAEDGSLIEPITDIDFKKSCFVITPLGEEGSDERKHADAMLKHLIEPVLKSEGIKVIRADKISKPGHITKQVVEHIAFCKLCITDLSFKNPNAHYELGIRHAFKLPSVQIIRKGDKIPFDVQQGRTIVIDTSDPYTIMDRLITAKAELSEHVKSLLSGAKNQEESPITMYLPGLVVKIGS